MNEWVNFKGCEIKVEWDGGDLLAADGIDEEGKQMTEEALDAIDLTELHFEYYQQS